MTSNKPKDRSAVAMANKRWAKCKSPAKRREIAMKMVAAKRKKRAERLGITPHLQRA